MPRPIRIEYEDACYHIISRGNEKQAIFIENSDYKQFLRIVGKLYDRYKFIIYAYALMENHFHLLVETPLGNLSPIMRELNGIYAAYFNHRYDRVGHLFQGRYKSILVDKENYLLELTRYIHLNPVRAKIVDIPEKYKWSSLKYYLGDNNIKWLSKDLVLNYFKSSNEKAQNAYLEFIYARINKEDDLLKNLYAQTILGKENFIKYVKDKFIDKAESPEEITNYKKLKSRLDLETLTKIITDHFSVEPEDLKAFKSKNNLARKFFILLARKYIPVKRKDTKEFLGQISCSGIGKIANRFLRETKNSKELQVELEKIEKKIFLMSHVRV